MGEPAAPPDEGLRGVKLGDYLVDEPLAWGGMGIIYRAHHPLIGRQVAIKVLRREWAHDPEQAERFLREAKALSTIKHRGIIEIIGFGHLDDGRQYMVMEFLDGEALSALLDRDAPLEPQRALALCEEVLDALSAAHKVGVVHRDLKPSNVFLSRQTNGARYVKLLDFGLAKQGVPGAALSGDQPFPKASLLAGTPEYVAPEQARGLAPTGRTDLYSLGVMMFEMLTGELPFHAGSMLELMNAHLVTPPPKLRAKVPHLSPALEELVDSMLQKEPSRRPPSADVVRLAVQRLIKQLREEATRVTTTPPPKLKNDQLPVPPLAEPTRKVVPAADTAPAGLGRSVLAGRLAIAVAAAALVLGAGFAARSGVFHRPPTHASPPAREQVEPQNEARAPQRPAAQMAQPPPADELAEPKPQVHKLRPPPAECQARDWRRALQERLEPLEQRYLRQPGTGYDDPALSDYRGLYERVAKAGGGECGGLSLQIDRWQAAHLK
jgi:serine/threonine-protein kinase